MSDLNVGHKHGHGSFCNMDYLIKYAALTPTVYMTHHDTECHDPEFNTLPACEL